MIKCIYCNLELPEHAKFCPKCLKQIVCFECNSILYKDSSICISCGKPVQNKDNTNVAVNNIEFTENENGKSFKASFTDTVAGNVVETFAQLLPLNKYDTSRSLTAHSNKSNIDYIEDAESIELQETTPENKIKKTKETRDNSPVLNKIFKNKDGDISIYDPRIKASSKSDFIGRITLLFLYYKEISGSSEVQRSELNTLLEKANLLDATIRVFLSKNPNLIENNQTYLELRPEGKERAEKILSEFEDESIPNGWELKSNGKKNVQIKDENKDLNKTKSQKKLLTYQIVQPQNLKPKDKKSLIDFCKEHSPKNNFEHNLLFVYYLEKILNEKPINIECLYTCYKEVGQKVPKNLYQSIIDTKKNKGWIESSDMGNIFVSVIGENYVEHDMKK